MTFREMVGLYLYNLKQLLNGYFIQAEPFIALFVTFQQIEHYRLISAFFE